MDEPASKRPKLESVEHQEVNNDPIDVQAGVSPPSLESLDDDCCLAIFEMLPLNDLCSMSNTCTRFQDLSKDIYRRRFKSKVLIVDSITDDGDMALGPDEQYTKCFAEFIQNVSLSPGVGTKAGLEVLKAFYRANAKKEEGECANGNTSNENEGVKRSVGPISTPIKTLRFENWRSGLRQSHGTVLADIIHDVEAVTFSNTYIDDDLDKKILRFLPNMQSLTVCGKPKKINDLDITWMEQTYPTLKHFAWHLKSEVPVDRLIQFIEANPNMQTFSLWSKSEKTISKLIGQGIGIDELFLDMTRDISKGLADLHLLCTADMGKQTKLHLKFSDPVRIALKHDLRRLAVLAPYIVGLYFEDDWVDDDLVKEIVKFENLKMIQLNIPQDKKAKWLTTIPSLEEIFIYRGVSTSNFSKYQKVLKFLMGEVKNLKKIYLRNNSRKFTEFGLEEFDAARRKLADAHKLKIYFKSDEPENTGRLSDTACGFDKIEALRVETENFDNPLVTEYLTTKGVGYYFKRQARRRSIREFFNNLYR